VARHPFLENEQTLEEFIDAWERGTLPKKSWTHGAHVGVAAYFAYEYPADVLIRVMRRGFGTTTWLRAEQIPRITGTTRR